MEEDLTVIIPEAKKVGSYVKMEDLWVEWVAAQPPMDEFKANKSFFNSTKPSRNHLKWIWFKSKKHFTQKISDSRGLEDFM